MAATLIVLCSDDEERRSWCAQLAAFGWRIYEAREIQAAIALAQTQQPHVVVTAVALPSGSGSHFVRALRSVVEHDVKIVGIAEAADLASALTDGGFDLVVTRPVDFAALQSSISVAEDHEDKKLTTRLPRLKE